MQKSYFLLMALWAIAIGGCATPQPPIVLSYEADATKVRFINNLEGGWIDLYPETECNNGINVIYDNHFNNLVKSLAEGAPKRLDMLDPPAASDRNIAEYSFKPGQRINIGTGGIGHQCLGGLSFIAMSESQYEVTLLPRPPNTCAFTVSMLALDGGTVKRYPVRNIGPLICRRAQK